MAAGGAVVVCAHCAEAAGLGAGQLRQGARIGTDEQVREIFLTADRVIDYQGLRRRSQRGSGRPRPFLPVDHPTER